SMGAARFAGVETGARTDARTGTVARGLSGRAEASLGATAVREACILGAEARSAGCADPTGPAGATVVAGAAAGAGAAVGSGASASDAATTGVGSAAGVGGAGGAAGSD